MTEEQIPQEIAGVIELIDSVYKVFGFEYHVELSTCPEDFIGTEEMRRTSEDALRSVMEQRGMDYVVNPATAPSTAPRSTSTSRTASAAPGSAVPSSSTTRCPSALTSLMLGQTGRSTVPS